MNKFKNAKKDEDTIIISSQETQIMGIDTRLEFWIYDCFSAMSAIFVAEDVQHLSDDDLKEMIRKEFNKSDSYISRNSPGYVFVNFDFTVID